MVPIKPGVREGAGAQGHKDAPFRQLAIREPAIPPRDSVNNIFFILDDTSELIRTASENGLPASIRRLAVEKVTEVNVTIQSAPYFHLYRLTAEQHELKGNHGRADHWWAKAEAAIYNPGDGSALEALRMLNQIHARLHRFVEAADRREDWQKAALPRHHDAAPKDVKRAKRKPSRE